MVPAQPRGAGAWPRPRGHLGGRVMGELIWPCGAVNFSECSGLN